MNQPKSPRRRLPLAGVLALALLAGCTVLKPDPDAHLATFTTRLAGSNEVPPTASMGTGTVDAVLDRNTLLLRWKMSFTNLSGPATLAHFHGPAAIGANAAPAVTMPPPVTEAYEGRATLTAAQAADLLAGRWYANVHTARYPAGELRGQMIERR
ncbi:MAG: CHRD domain-containing protein [Pseudomonadota bacterium]